MAQTLAKKTPQVKLAVIEPRATGQSARVTDNFNVIDLLLSGHVLTKGQTTPPASPVDGDSHIIGVGATGVWAAKDNQIAGWYNSTWLYFEPELDYETLVSDVNRRYRFDGTNWLLQAAQTLHWATKTASFTISASEAGIYWIDASSGALNVTMLNPATYSGKTWKFKRKDNNPGNVVTFLPSASETVERTAGLVGLAAQDSVITLSSDGVNWVVV